ncbi:hypothetical protein [Fretibacter rubidus]|uniref:hypothetical protein n=1 Tax=Fretibacter rubidus TaxID=570162 RepID=UPI00352AD6D4
MIIWLRNIVLIVFILSAIYAVLTITGRMRAKKRLQAEYAMLKPKTDETTFVASGLVKYDKTTQPKLLLFIFIVPTITTALLIYLAQHS